MHAWAVYTICYVTGYGVISLTVYAVLSLLARAVVIRIVNQTCAEIVKDFRAKSSCLLERGQEVALAGPQRAVLGHLIAPHLEKFTEWVGSRLTSSRVEQSISDRCVEACLDQLQRRKWTLSLVTAQVAMGLLAAGYLLRGVL